MILKIPSPIPVYFNGHLTTTLTLTPNVPLVIPYNVVDLISSSCGPCSPNIYNGLTGSVTIPKCGNGIYTLTAHTTITTTEEGGSTFTISINVDGISVAADTKTLAMGDTVDVDLTSGPVALRCGQVVNVTVTTTTAGGSVLGVHTYFGLVLVSAASC
jgi:hypothetical protein